MTNNPILDELYEIRSKLLADADGDVHKYLEGVRKRERESGRLLEPRAPVVNAAESSGGNEKMNESVHQTR